MKKQITVLLALLLVLALAAGCSATATPTTSAATTSAATTSSQATTQPAQKYSIGVSVPSLEFTFFATMKTAIEEAYPTGTVEVKVYDGENSQEKQNKDIEDMITMGFDGIVLIPITVEGATPAIAYANEKKIPVITVDREVTEEAGVEVVGFVGADHVTMGEGAGELLIEALEKKFPGATTWNVIEIEGTQGASATIKRGEGIHKILDNNKKINVIATLDGDFSTTNALNIAEDSLIANKDLNAFICHNDNMADGCYQALLNANRVGDVVIIGIDGQLATVKTIQAGGIQGTVIQYPKMVTLGIELLEKYLNGEKIEYYNYYPTDKCGPDQVEKFIAEGKPW